MQRNKSSCNKSEFVLTSHQLTDDEQMMLKMFVWVLTGEAFLCLQILSAQKHPEQLKMFQWS